MYIVTETIFADGQPSSGQRCDNEREFIEHARSLAIRISEADANGIATADQAKAYLKDFPLAKVQVINKQAFLLRDDWHGLVIELARDLGWAKTCIAEDIMEACGADILRITEYIESEGIPRRKKFHEGTTIYTFEDGSSVKSRGHMIVVMTPEE